MFHLCSYKALVACRGLIQTHQACLDHTSPKPGRIKVCS